MLVVDVETTGLNPYRNGILSIGAVNFKYPENYYYAEGRPQASVVLEKRALEINGFTEEELRALPKPMIEVMVEFYEWINQQPKDTPLIIGGHNVGFDIWFLRAEHERCGLKNSIVPFKYRGMDLHSTAMAHYALKKGFMYPGDMPADYIQEKLGLPIEPSPHNALNGAVFEAECFSRLLFNRILFTDFEQYPVKENPWI